MLPIVLTKKQKVLIIGAGRACGIKLKSLIKNNYDITIVSNKFNILLKTSNITKIKADFYSLDESFFAPFNLIYIAIKLDNHIIVKKLLEYKLVNILSDPTLSNFRHPCSREDNDIIVSVTNKTITNPKRACTLAEKFLILKAN